LSLSKGINNSRPITPKVVIRLLLNMKLQYRDEKNFKKDIDIDVDVAVI